MPRSTPPRSGASPHPTEDKLDSSVWERPSTHKLLFIGLIVVCVALVGADLLHQQHGHFPYEEVTAFHAGFGFLAYVAIVSTAKVLRRLIGRPEDYYDE